MQLWGSREVKKRKINKKSSEDRWFVSYLSNITEAQCGAIMANWSGIQTSWSKLCGTQKVHIYRLEWFSVQEALIYGPAQFYFHLATVAKTRWAVYRVEELAFSSGPLKKCKWTFNTGLQIKPLFFCLWLTTAYMCGKTPLKGHQSTAEHPEKENVNLQPPHRWAKSSQLSMKHLTGAWINHPVILCFRRADKSFSRKRNLWWVPSCRTMTIYMLENCV